MMNMLNIEHLIENAVCDLEKYEVQEAYKQFIESPCNIELAEGTGIRLDDVWVMAVYCTTTLRQDWKEKWEDEACRWIPVTERLPEEWTEVFVFARCHPDSEGFVQTAVYTGNPGKWRVTWDHCLLEDNIVTHWMPLPEPPEMDGGE